MLNMQRTQATAIAATTGQLHGAPQLLHVCGLGKCACADQSHLHWLRIALTGVRSGHGNAKLQGATSGQSCTADMFASCWT